MLLHVNEYQSGAREILLVCFQVCFKELLKTTLPNAHEFPIPGQFPRKPLRRAHMCPSSEGGGGVSVRPQTWTCAQLGALRGGGAGVGHSGEDDRRKQSLLHSFLIELIGVTFQSQSSVVAGPSQVSFRHHLSPLYPLLPRPPVVIIILLCLRVWGVFLNPFTFPPPSPSPVTSVGLVSACFVH